MRQSNYKDKEFKNLIELLCEKKAASAKESIELLFDFGNFLFLPFQFFFPISIILLLPISDLTFDCLIHRAIFVDRAKSGFSRNPVLSLIY